MPSRHDAAQKATHANYTQQHVWELPYPSTQKKTERTDKDTDTQNTLNPFLENNGHSSYYIKQ